MKVPCCKSSPLRNSLTIAGRMPRSDFRKASTAHEQRGQNNTSPTRGCCSRAARRACPVVIKRTAMCAVDGSGKIIWQRVVDTRLKAIAAALKRWRNELEKVRTGHWVNTTMVGPCIASWAIRWFLWAGGGPGQEPTGSVGQRRRLFGLRKEPRFLRPHGLPSANADSRASTTRSSLCMHAERLSARSAAILKNSMASMFRPT